MAARNSFASHFLSCSSEQALLFSKRSFFSDRHLKNLNKLYHDLTAFVAVRYRDASCYASLEAKIKTVSAL